MTSVLDLTPPASMPRPTPPSRRHLSQGTPERIVLTGFMGSGKTTVGRLLAAELGWEFLDLDNVVEQRTGLSVPQLFAERGEAAFRKEETAALAAALRHSHAVVALGGGAPETLSNRLFLEQTPATKVVYLAAPFAILEARCTAQAADPSLPARPVFSDASAALARFEIRQPLYRRLASITIDTSAQLPHQTVAEIAAAIAGKSA